jgi:hypothetical protein
MPRRSASAEATAAELELPVRPRAGVSLHLIDDEGVLLDTAGQTLYGVNTADLLSARIPDLSTLPVHGRLDGKRVKYLVPQGASDDIGLGAHHPASAVIFPRRRDRRSAELVRLSPATALTRLAPEFCPLGGALDDKRVDRLIGWIRGMTCFEMRYSTLDDGIKIIGELCS